MINMKQSRKEATMLSECCADDAPEYPYGLRLQLDEGSLAKLSINDLPEVGATMHLTARVEVVSVSQYEHVDGRNKDVGLQITDMDLRQESKTTGAQSLYPNSNMN